MKIALINPPFSSKCMRDFRCQTSVEGFIEETMPPLALAYVASFLRENGFNITLIDCIADEIHLETLIKKLRENKPDLVVSVSATPTFQSDIHVVSEIKKQLPDSLTCLFGTHPTVFPKETLQNEGIDFVVMGEAEYTVLELANALSKVKETKLHNIDGLAWKDNKKIVINKKRELIADLDSLPFPARDLLPMYKYTGFLTRRKPYTLVLSSRGCTASCLFCSSQIMLERKWRGRSPENVISELELLVNDFGIKEVFFNDDCFTMDKNRVKEICGLMKKKGLDLAWGCETRVDRVDEETLKTMKDAGCYKIVFGLESGNKKVLEKLKKNANLDQVKQAVKWTKKAGIYANGTFIIGVPWETKETVQETIDFAIELDLDHATFFMATPMPGTEFYDVVVKEKLFRNKPNWNNFQMFSNSVVKSHFLSNEEIIKFRSKAYKQFYLRPTYIIKRLLKIRSFNELKIVIKTGIFLLKMAVSR